MNIKHIEEQLSELVKDVKMIKKELSMEPAEENNIKGINISVEQRMKYTEKKGRKTYYIDNELLDKIENMNKTTGHDKSDIVNSALGLFFKHYREGK
jgi:hypothetical protein